MEKKIYVIDNYENENSVVIWLTQDQANVLDWFIDYENLNEQFGIGVPEETAIDITYDVKRFK